MVMRARTCKTRAHTHNTETRNSTIRAEQGDLLLSIYRFALECIMVLNATCGAGFESKNYIKVISHVSV